MSGGHLIQYPDQRKINFEFISNFEARSDVHNFTTGKLILQAGYIHNSTFLQRTNSAYMNLF